MPLIYNIIVVTTSFILGVPNSKYEDVIIDVKYSFQSF